MEVQLCVASNALLQVEMGQNELLNIHGTFHQKHQQLCYEVIWSDSVMGFLLLNIVVVGLLPTVQRYNDSALTKLVQNIKLRWI